MTAFSALVGQTLRLAVRAGGGAIVALVFFLAVVTVIPFGVGPDLKLLARIGPAILWIAALLASLLGLERLFGADREDGSLDVYFVSGEPLFVYALGRAAGHWIATGLPIVIAAPILGLLLNLEPRAMAAVALTLSVGTPALTLIGAVGAALTAGLPRGGLLVTVLVLPFTIPVLIFGVLATQGAISDPEPFIAPFLLLCAGTLAALVLAPIAAAAALKLALE
jgi:heme exporter protein B